MIYEEGSTIVFNGEDGENFNRLARNPNKETIRKRDLFFKEIDKFMDNVIIDGDDIIFETEEHICSSEDLSLENSFLEEKLGVGDTIWCTKVYKEPQVTECYITATKIENGCFYFFVSAVDKAPWGGIFSLEDISEEVFLSEEDAIISIKEKNEQHTKDKFGE